MQLRTISVIVACFVGLSPILSGLDVQDFGAVPDGTTDSTAAIQSAFDMAVAQGDDIHFPPGKYRITAGLTLHDGRRTRLVGIGDARIFWDGMNAASSILTLSDGMEYVVDGLTIIALRPAAIGLSIYNDPAATVMNPQRYTIRRLSIEGVNGKIGKAVCVGGTNAQNDFHYFETCNFANYSIAGLSLEGTQAYTMEVVNCHFRGYGFGKYGITTFVGPGATGGSFAVRGGMFAANTEADIYLGTPSPGPITIDGCNSEGSPRFFRSANHAASAWVRIVGCRYAGNAIAADKRFIWIGHAGTTIIESCNLATYAPGETKIYAEGTISAGYRRLMVRGCNIASTSAAIFENITPVELVGCWRTEGVHNLFPLIP